MKKLKFAAVALAAAIALAGCGGASDGSSVSHNTYSESKSYEGTGSTYSIASATDSEPDTVDEGYANENGEASGDDGSILRKQEDQKIVYTGEMEIQTLDYDILNRKSVKWAVSPNTKKRMITITDGMITNRAVTEKIKTGR